MDKSPLTANELNASLRALARADRENGAAAGVRTRLLQEVRTLGAARRRTILKSAILITIVSMATVVPVWQLAMLEKPLRQSARFGEGATALESELVTAFYPLEYSTVPISGGRLVRMEVPPSALEAFGLSEATEVRDRTASNRLLADVLVGDDGLARAVRFVRLPRRESQQESLR
jgi:hypothetical protein